MGYYIETPAPRGKARQIAELHQGIVLDHVPAFEDVPDDKAAICVVENAAFEAACFVHDEREYRDFTLPFSEDPRPRTWVLIPWEKAVESWCE